MRLHIFSRVRLNSLNSTKCFREKTVTFDTNYNVFAHVQIFLEIVSRNTDTNHIVKLWRLAHISITIST